ncbi:hypothetical protein HJC23_003691 [Cyclotella cryptica]|uniref:CSD domain-containing protein n=1 Tax=Cyclotella cryptica TaxID=29204 RepID=A0ABD3P3J9_9STRA
MSSQKNGQQSMGNLFMQQPRNRAASSAPPSTNKMALLSSGTSNTGAWGRCCHHDHYDDSGKESRSVKSFADIQREQQNEKQQPKQQPPRNESNKERPKSNTPKILQRPPPTNHSRNNNHPPSRRASQDITPIKQGIIHTLLDKFGFIHCADRPVDLFVHSTSIITTASSNVQWHELNISKEVEFRWGTVHDVPPPPPQAGRKRKSCGGCATEEVEGGGGSIAGGSGEGEDQGNSLCRGRQRGRWRGGCGGFLCFFGYVPKSSSARLETADIVEFSMFTERFDCGRSKSNFTKW